MRTCIKSFVDEFVRSEFVANWTADNDNQGYGSLMDRFERVQDAAEVGAYGATHYEIIQDWRDALDDYIKHYRGSRQHRIEVGWLDRFRAAVSDHFDEVEAWHETNGSLPEEIG